jgi:DNA-3-methyladenine glycosylase
LCEALGITGKHNGLPLDGSAFTVHAREKKPTIAKGIRIGITKAAELPWRYGVKGSAFLSKRFPAETI